VLWRLNIWWLPTGESVVLLNIWTFSAMSFEFFRFRAAGKGLVWNWCEMCLAKSSFPRSRQGFGVKLVWNGNCAPKVFNLRAAGKDLVWNRCEMCLAKSSFPRSRQGFGVKLVWNGNCAPKVFNLRAAGKDLVWNRCNLWKFGHFLGKKLQFFSGHGHFTAKKAQIHEVIFFLTYILERNEKYPLNY